ncbi:MAG: M48 family metallopeptidase [Candidatus Thiodiazotropha sp. (ex Lucinoma borealis)]|nr:M48 family metallopeptidase [Candidatus Thiodiazotropha sp. (ex Lucinoma borealis)]
MKYRNPTLPEGINTSKTHPLREFLLLSLGALALISILVVTLGYFGGQLSRWLVSIETENEWAERWMEPYEDNETPPPLRSYLDSIGDKMQVALTLPEGMRIHLIYNNDDTVNAYATLGGRITLYRGLLEKIPHENALAMLIAHEIAHVESRDPIVSIGSSVGILTALSLLLSSTDISPLQETGLLTQLAFSRDMEEDADTAALQAVADVYGHVSGADGLFRIIQAEHSGNDSDEPPAFLSTHPLDEKRIEAIKHIAHKKGWRLDLPTTPLPAQFKAWINSPSVPQP